MHKRHIFAIAAILMWSYNCNAASLNSENNAVTPTDRGHTPGRNGYTFRTEVRTILDGDEVRWDTIVVYLTDAQGRTQILYSQAQPLDTTYWGRSSFGGIKEDDWNFDSIPDLQVCMGPMNGFGNYTYDVWLWDEAKQSFVPLPCDDLIFNPDIDPYEKRITGFWRLDDEVEIVRYKWIDGKLVEYEREEFLYSDMTDD